MTIQKVLIFGILYSFERRIIMEKKIVEERKEIQAVNLPKFILCSGERCRDCAYIEMDNDHYGDGTRRCSFKGEWVRPGDPACARFRP